MASFDRKPRAATRMFGLVLAFLLAGCGAAPDTPPPPPSLRYAGLPVQGSLADATGAGFGNCIQMTGNHLRCRRSGVMLLGEGPYEAAIDLIGSDGSGGFRQLTLWHDRDQSAPLKVAEVLKRQGWTYSYTGEGDRGDQMVLVHKGAPVHFSVDLSYWGKRRIRILPE